MHSLGAVAAAWQKIYCATSLQEAVSCTIDTVLCGESIDAVGVYLVNGDTLSINSRGVDEKFVEEYKNLPPGADPIFERACVLRMPVHSNSDDFAPRWHGTKLYSELAKPCGLEHYLVAPIWRRSEIAGAITIARRAGARPFAQEDLFFLQSMGILLSAHLSYRLDDLKSEISCLNERERDIAILVAKGMSNAEIGDLLGVSTNTIKKYLKTMFTKLAVTKRAELAWLLTSAGII